MKKIFFIYIVYLFSMSFVFATNTFVNDKGIVIDGSAYQWMKDYLSDYRIRNMTQDEYNKTLSLNHRLVNRTEKYFVTNTLISRNKLMEPLSITTEITEEEYANFEINRWACVGDDDEDCWETNAKKLVLSVGCALDSNVNCGFYIQNEWKTNPSVRSYDVIAVRWTGLTMTEMDSYQYTYINGLQEETNYTSSSNNVKINSNGVGVSMNLYNNGELFVMDLDVRGTRTSSMDVFGTYQHATSSVTLAQSKSYTFDASGLGNVLYYSNSTIRNKYDGMQGVSMVGVLP